jgi:hypothetical protein
MANYTYPAPAVTVLGDGTTEQISYFLKSPNLIRRRLQDLTAQHFISDFLLPAHFEADGGAILYETGETLFPADSPEAVAAGSEYKLISMTRGQIAAAKTVKWGFDTRVTDEMISRDNFQPVERALVKLANGMVKQVDSVALGVIASKATTTFAAPANWSGNAASGNVAGPTIDAGAIIDSVLQAKATSQQNFIQYGTYDYDTAIVTPLQFAKIAASFLKANTLPREAGNPIVNSGVLLNYLGLNWVTSLYTPSTNPILVDTSQLGGMADENIQSPGYSTTNSNGAPGVQAKSIRDDERDQWRLRARRVTVPIVTDYRAAITITGTGL